MTLENIQKEAIEKFDEGCNTDNISDPPSDTSWIKNFISTQIKNAYQRGQEKEQKRVKDILLRNVVTIQDFGSYFKTDVMKDLSI